MRVTSLLAGATLILAGLPASAATVFFDGFESPSLNGGYRYGGTDGAGAQFSPASPNPDYDGAGIQSTGSAFNYQPSPEGRQTAFIQGTGSFTETVNNLTQGATYTLSFFAAQRGGFQNDPFSVNYTPTGGDDPILLTVTPGSTNWTKYSATFTSVGTGGLFQFAGLNSSQNGNIDFNAGIDAVSISTGGVPEPSTWAMMLLGFGGLGFLAYRKTRKDDAGTALLAA